MRKGRGDNISEEVPTHIGFEENNRKAFSHYTKQMVRIHRDRKEIKGVQIKQNIVQPNPSANSADCICRRSRLPPGRWFLKKIGEMLWTKART